MLSRDPRDSWWSEWKKKRDQPHDVCCSYWGKNGEVKLLLTYSFENYTYISFLVQSFGNPEQRKRTDAKIHTCLLSFVLALGSPVTEREMSHCPGARTALVVRALYFQIDFDTENYGSTFVLLLWWEKGTSQAGRCGFEYLWFWDLV